MSNYKVLAPYGSCPRCGELFQVSADPDWKEMVTYRCPDGHYIHHVSSFGEIVIVEGKEFYIVYPVEKERMLEVEDYVNQIYPEVRSF